MKEQPSGLISVLLNSTVEFGDRHDAAMDLSQYDEAEAESALSIIATDPQADSGLADACGESLGEIWCRKERIDFDVFNRLHPVSKEIAVAHIKAFKPNLLAERNQ